MEALKRKNLSGIRFLSFLLNNEEYCIDILRIKEIIGSVSITPLPRTPDFIKGVFNLRGKIIPIVDLRIKFGFENAEYTERTCIIVVEIDYREEATLLGLVVDKPQEVLIIPEERISMIPYLNTQIKAEYINGIAEYGDTVKIILDIGKVLTDEEFVILEKLSNKE